MLAMERRIPAALTLLCAVLSGVGALEVVIPLDQYEFARGDNITLPCSFTSKVKPPEVVIITWSIEGLQANAKENVILTHYHPIRKTDISQSYEGRASPDIDVPKGKANLKLKSIMLGDNKMFECRVQIPGDDEGTPADTARLVVLVAPSKPICKIEGKAEYGQNINLTCHSEEGSPPPEYSWEVFDVERRPRQLPGVSNRGAIKPLLNISRETSGFYICTSKNKIRSASCNITLAVMPPSMNIGSTAGIIAGVVAFLIALIVIIYCCCCRKKKEDDKEYAMGVRQDEYHDKEADGNGENRRPEREESVQNHDKSEVRSATDRRDQYEDRSERDYDRGREYDDRGRNYDDRGRDYDDRDRNYDDRGRNYDDRDRDYDDRRSDYTNRRSEYDDRASDYDNRRERYDDDRRYEDERRYDERRDDDRY
ncbi:cell surface A33 antigen-like [Salarias fasciatus]|uniref:Cell surface A33 antigen-like n=1 Tax=Salarias fasciatus TaxID=181472 RepID=A0A672G079_SALFA|nr:cell surface A33 antigen-like [Salarias fasciatus]